MKYLFGRIKEIEKKIKGRRILLFLDYDGTLAPIVKRPQDTVLSAGMKKLLRGLAASPLHRVAIISGRSLKDIKDQVGLEGIIYAANHGLEIDGPKIRFENPMSQQLKKSIRQIKDGLSRKVSSVEGAVLEDKGMSLSLHYRLVDKKRLHKLKTILHETAIPYLVGNKISIRRGKKVFEIRPALNWDKGRAALWLMARYQFALRDEPVVPVYIGDDETDEDAFRALRGKGLTIFVGSPRKSRAEYYLKDTKEVFKFLKICRNL